MIRESYAFGFAVGHAFSALGAKSAIIRYDRSAAGTYAMLLLIPGKKRQLRQGSPAIGAFFLPLCHKRAAENAILRLVHDIRPEAVALHFLKFFPLCHRHPLLRNTADFCNLDILCPFRTRACRKICRTLPDIQMLRTVYIPAPVDCMQRPRPTCRTCGRD